MILDTTFVIDLERELGRDTVGPAQRFLEAHSETAFYLTFTVAGELAAGPRERREPWEHLVRPFRILESTHEIAWRYGRLYRYLADNGQLIGANDLWIAATALAHRLPVVTRNEGHFRRVPALFVRTY